MVRRMPQTRWAEVYPDRVYYDGRCEVVLAETTKRPRRRCTLPASTWHPSGFAVCRNHVSVPETDIDDDARRYRQTHTEVSHDTIESAYCCEAWLDAENEPCIARACYEDETGGHWCYMHRPGR